MDGRVAQTPGAFKRRRSLPERRRWTGRDPEAGPAPLRADFLIPVKVPSETGA